MKQFDYHYNIQTASLWNGLKQQNDFLFFDTILKKRPDLQQKLIRIGNLYT
jgi:Zn-dependent M32 family carboxypeptidase